MAVFDIINEPRGHTYRQLMTACAAWASMVLLVVRADDALDDFGKNVLRTLGEHLIDVRERSEWPGTKLLEGTATVYRFEVRPVILSALQDSVGGLYDWTQPLPEDLCLLRRDGTPLLVTIAHERDAYLDLAQHEVDLVIRSVTDLELVRRPGKE
jgi:hypothetical protein